MPHAVCGAMAPAPSAGTDQRYARRGPPRRELSAGREGRGKGAREARADQHGNAEETFGKLDV